MDLGCGYGDLGGVLYRLGADIICVDARQEHLKVLSKKFQGIKTVKADLDSAWPFFGQKYDLILDLGITCHLSNYKKHIQEVCASTTHLVLEMAVCDSDDSELCIAVPEDKEIYDLSINGMGCRPTTAAVEKLLRECGMNFKRMDNSKFNTDEFKYDWVPKNDKSINISKRRIWFCVKESSPIQFANPNSEIAFKPAQTPTVGYIAPNQNATKITADPKPPPVSNLTPIKTANSEFSKSIEVNNQTNMTLNEQVSYDSLSHVLLTPETFSVPSDLQSDISGIITLNSLSSKMWYKKISPFFPNLQIFGNAPSMSGFSKTKADSNIVMCSLNTLQKYNRIWLEEWSGSLLTPDNINTLKQCSTIITPSLLNAQEIWKHIPNANIIRMCRPWPILSVTPSEGNYYLYFEKSPVFTKLLFNSWNESFGNLAVVGPTIPVPHFAKFFSKYDSYEDVSKLILGCKAIIDLSENDYYASGILKMADEINLHTITNNHFDLKSKQTFIQRDKNTSLYPTSDSIKLGINAYNKTNIKKANVSSEYINSVASDLKKLLGT